MVSQDPNIYGISCRVKALERLLFSLSSAFWASPTHRDEIVELFSAVTWVRNSVFKSETQKSHKVPRNGASINTPWPGGPFCSCCSCLEKRDRLPRLLQKEHFNLSCSSHNNVLSSHPSWLHPSSCHNKSQPTAIGCKSAKTGRQSWSHRWHPSEQMNSWAKQNVLNLAVEQMSSQIALGWKGP